MTKLQLILLFAAFLLAPILLLAAITWIFGAIRGNDWRSLAEMYPAPDRPSGATFRFRTLEMAYASKYRGVTLVISERGLYVGGSGPFRLGRPAMLIPWSAVEEVTGSSLMLETWIRVTPPGITMRITPIVFDAVRKHLPKSVKVV